MSEKEIKSAEIKLPGKIPTNREQRRRIKITAGKFLKMSQSYILVAWNGIENEEPICIIDVETLNGKEHVVSKVMGKIAQHAAACVRFCEDQLKMTEAERNNSALAKQIKAMRSADLAKELEADEYGKFRIEGSQTFEAMVENDDVPAEPEYAKGIREGLVSEGNAAINKELKEERE